MLEYGIVWFKLPLVNDLRVVYLREVLMFSSAQEAQLFALGLHILGSDIWLPFSCSVDEPASHESGASQSLNVNVV